MIVKKYPATIQFLPLPANFQDRDKRIFTDCGDYNIPAHSIRIENDVDIHGRGPIRDSHGNYLREAFVSDAELIKWKRRRGPWRTSLERLVQATSVINKKCVWITDNWSCGYFHWMCDALPRLEKTLQSIDPIQLTVVLPAKFKRYDYFRESLAALGIREIRILDYFERVRCRELVLPSHVGTTGVHHESTMQSLRNRISSQYLPAPQSPKAVYISRRRAGRRRIENEPEILPVLLKHGFEIVVAEDLSWKEQIQIAMNAEFLISNHGAGLSNMMMMNNGSKVLEIRRRGDSKNACYQILAAAMNLDYYYLMANPTNESETAHSGNVIVNPQALDHAIHQMMGPNQQRLIA